jgi:hypothetical protein
MGRHDDPAALALTGPAHAIVDPTKTGLHVVAAEASSGAAGLD